MNLGIYLHIPFCRQKCRYCDFPSVAGHEELMERYCAALRREITGVGGLFHADAVDTVYFGGGTPSLLPPSALAELLEGLAAAFHIADYPEISMEANPGTVDQISLRQLRQAGINRISFGVQSFDNDCLRTLGRIHDAATAAKAVGDAQAAGFENVSVDLMYGLPGQTPKLFATDIRTAAGLGVSHVSAYGLKVEEGTPFWTLSERGDLYLPSEEAEEEMYLAMTMLLPELGYQRYEISNFAQPGQQCRHNLKYWRCEPYLGLGAAAHSYFGGERRGNTPDVKHYIDCLAMGTDPAVMREKLPPASAAAEYIFLGLRTVDGVDLADFKQRFGFSLRDGYPAQIAKLKRQGLLDVEDRKIRLTEKGMQFGNAAFMAFLPD